MKAFALNVLAYLIATILAVPVIGGLIYIWVVFF